VQKLCGVPSLMRVRDDLSIASPNKSAALPVLLPMQSLDQNNNRMSPLPTFKQPKPVVVGNPLPSITSPLPTSLSAVHLNLSSASCQYSTPNRFGSHEVLSARRANSDCDKSPARRPAKLYNFKVLVLGEMASGKSSYIRKLAQCKLPPSQPTNHYKATVSTSSSLSLLTKTDPHDPQSHTDRHRTSIETDRMGPRNAGQSGAVGHRRSRELRSNVKRVLSRFVRSDFHVRRIKSIEFRCDSEMETMFGLFGSTQGQSIDSLRFGRQQSKHFLLRSL
jgi:hypothetical protein